MRAFPQQWLKVSVRLFLLCLLSLFCASAAFAQAQSDAADLQGYVRDPQGAVVQNAKVTARNPATNFSRTVNTNGEGYYQILNLPPGEYEVTVEATNYKKAVVSSAVRTAANGSRRNLPRSEGAHVQVRILNLLLRAFINYNGDNKRVRRNRLRSDSNSGFRMAL